MDIKRRRIGGRVLALMLCAVVIAGLCAGLMTVPAAAQDSGIGKYEGIKLIPGGVPFGVKFNTEGVVVVGFCDLDGLQKTQTPAYLAGLRPKDVIIKVGGKSVKDTLTLTQIIEESDGKELSLTYTRGGAEKSTKLTPIFSKTDGKYKTGIWVRDSGAGIGTITYVDPRTGCFGGLGHGICDGETGELIPMNCGVVTDVKISAVKKGIVGVPGEIKGYFGSEKRGKLTGNTDCGIFGLLTNVPAGLTEAIPVGTRETVHSGEAKVLCTFEDGQRREYKLEIGAVDKDAKGSKCFVIKVTDPALIEKTGGIVQGMSGSPIIQNGKLIGAVTHVMINDPTVGYGIFIENMLNAAQMPTGRAA